MQDEAGLPSGLTITRPSPYATSTTSSIGTERRGSSKDGTRRSAEDGPSSPSSGHEGGGEDDGIVTPELVTQVLTIPNRVPGLNDLEEWRGQSGQGKRRWNRYNAEKTKWTGYIVLQCRLQKIQPFDTEERPVRFTFMFVEASKRRDPDNFAGAGMKFVLDALKQAGVIVNDGWKHVGRPFVIDWAHGASHVLEVRMTGVLARVRP